MRSVELCAGAGGLALATTQAGFTPVALLENDAAACETISESQRRGGRWVKAWPTISPVDIRKFDCSMIAGPIDLLSGGPPCQPFSPGGKLLGIEDDRDLFAEVSRAVRCLRPRAVLVENTKGLAQRLFQKQLRYILLQLAFPERCRKPGEHWESFLVRLERAAAGKPGRDELRYDVTHAVLNAADYGVPQRRERLIIVGFRGDVPASPPEFVPTHSLDLLLYQQWVTGEYWERHKVTPACRPHPPGKWKARIERIAKRPKPGGRPWVTVRDAFASLPPPFAAGRSSDPPNHYARDGARAYRKHTGSCFDLPAKVIKAGKHGVPGGENMLAYSHGGVRYFTIRECARLQSFPDDYLKNRAAGSSNRQSVRSWTQ